MKAPDLARSMPPQPLEDKAKHYEKKTEPDADLAPGSARFGAQFSI